MGSGPSLAELICDFNGGYNIYYLPCKNVTVNYTATTCGALYDTQVYANGPIQGPKGHAISGKICRFLQLRAVSNLSCCFDGTYSAQP